GQYRIGGARYITHPMEVAEILRDRGFSTEYQIAALFHDLLEDTDATEEMIELLGGHKVLEAVRLLTKEQGYSMRHYISRIKSNPIAFAVKGADRLNNLRCALAADEKFKRRYIKETEEWYMDFSDEIPKALEVLKSTLEE
ncbi:MAG: HD domain-containing protein, partial [Firmicutes bacterium]|nr:HD domain-containing protein [Bacillota bacterium]